MPWNEAKAVAASLKPIYQAPTLEDAEAALEAFSEQRDEKCPAISQIWLRHWENIIPIFDYPMAIRKVNASLPRVAPSAPLHISPSALMNSYT